MATSILGLLIPWSVHVSASTSKSLRARGHNGWCCSDRPCRDRTTGVPMLPNSGETPTFTSADHQTMTDPGVVRIPKVGPEELSNGERDKADYAASFKKFFSANKDKILEFKITTTTTENDSLHEIKWAMTLSELLYGFGKQDPEIQELIKASLAHQSTSRKDTMREPNAAELQEYSAAESPKSGGWFEAWKTASGYIKSCLWKTEDDKKSSNNIMNEIQRNYKYPTSSGDSGYVGYTGGTRSPMILAGATHSHSKTHNGTGSARDHTQAMCKERNNKNRFAKSEKASNDKDPGGGYLIKRVRAIRQRGDLCAHVQSMLRGFQPTFHAARYSKQLMNIFYFDLWIRQLIAKNAPSTLNYITNYPHYSGVTTPRIMVDKVPDIEHDDIFKHTPGYLSRVYNTRIYEESWQHVAWNSRQLELYRSALLEEIKLAKLESREVEDIPYYVYMTVTHEPLKWDHPVHKMSLVSNNRVQYCDDGWAYPANPEDYFSSKELREGLNQHHECDSGYGSHAEGHERREAAEVGGDYDDASDCTEEDPEDIRARMVELERPVAAAGWRNSEFVVKRENVGTEEDALVKDLNNKMAAYMAEWSDDDE